MVSGHSEPMIFRTVSVVTREMFFGFEEIRV
jgi:hypothetical protein